jgi:hypothetical protein
VTLSQVWTHQSITDEKRIVFCAGIPMEAHIWQAENLMAAPLSVVIDMMNQD